jgi:uncharacterized repeat protein (TIGR01451 family)
MMGWHRRMLGHAVVAMAASCVLAADTLDSKTDTGDEAPLLRPFLAPKSPGGPSRIVESGPVPVTLAPDLGEVVSPAAVPANDLCGGALVIPGAGPFPYATAAVNITDATTAGDPTPTCAFQDSSCTPNCFSRGIWYTFTPTTTAPYRFSTCGGHAPTGTHPDTVLAIFTSAGGCGGAFTQAACNDDDGLNCGYSPFDSTLSARLTAGTTYYVVAYNWGQLLPGNPFNDISISVERMPDNCTLGARPLVLGTNVGHNGGALNDYTLSGTACFSGIGHTTTSATGRDSVYSFTAPSAGAYSFKAQSWDPAAGGNLVLYTSPSCPAPGSISCTAPVVAVNRQTGTTVQVTAEEVHCRTLASGETLYLFLDELSIVSTGGNTLIEISRCGLEAEPNNTPGAANPVDACPMEGAITAGEADFFSLGSPAAGTRAFVTVDGLQANSGDFQLRLTSATDTLEFDDDDMTAGWSALSPTIAGRALPGGPAYLRLNHFTATTASEPYRVYPVLEPPGGDPYGSSSSPELRDATNNGFAGVEFAGNNYFRGTISSTSDRDLYLFCANEGDAITVNVDGDPGRNLTPIRTAIRTWDAFGNPLLAISDANTATVDNTSGVGSLAWETPRTSAQAITFRARESGPHFVSVEVASATNVPAASDYLLAIGTNCVGPPMATLGTELTASAPTVANGEIYSYTVRLTNDGPQSALIHEFTHVLPPNVKFLGISGTGTDAAGCSSLPPVGQSGTITCSVDCMRVGGSFEFEIQVQAPYCTGDILLTSTVEATTLTALDGASVLTDSVTVNVVDDGACDDGLFCTLGDHCEAGSCTFTDMNSCDDSNLCTIDSCDEDNGCFNSPDVGFLCDDGDPCTTIDLCLEDAACHGLEPLGSPSEVSGLQFDDKTTLSWGADAVAFTYDALRGDVAALPVGPGGGDEVCFADLAGTSTTDATVPAPDAAFWYLVRGENTCAPAGSYGNDSLGNPRSTTTCP